MTFDEWWDSSKSKATPDTYKGCEESCRQAWEAAQAGEMARIRAAKRRLVEIAFGVEIYGAPCNDTLARRLHDICHELEA